MQRRRWTALVLMLTLLGNAALAQEEEGTFTDAPARDPIDLAQRYQRVLDDPGALEVEPAPDYRVGDIAEFWVTDYVINEHDQVSASVAEANASVYLWVKEGLNLGTDSLAQAAQTLEENVLPTIRALLGAGGAMPPGIDGDPHTYILHTFPIDAQTTAYFDELSRLPAAVARYSNERELVVINPQEQPDFMNSDAYYAYLARELGHMLLHLHDPDEATWVDAGLAMLASWDAGYPQLAAQNLSAFFEKPDTQLTNRPIHAQPDSHYGAAFLFALYVRDRLGDDLIRAWATAPGNGMAGLDEALAEIDAGTTAQTLFADWLATNAINDPAFAPEEGDEGRYAYTTLETETGPLFGVDAIFDIYPVRVSNAAIYSFGAHYIVLAPDEPKTLQFAFQGAQTVPLLPVAPHSGEYMYWSNRQGNMDSTLTRAFDLSGVQADEDVTLAFWAWYDIKEYWDYAYVSVSTDGGTTWEALPATSTTYEDPHRLAVGDGFTGSSGGVGRVPYPALGVNFEDEDVLVITAVPEGSPAAEAGLEVGDTLMTVEGLPVETAEDITGRELSVDWARIESPTDLSAILATFNVGDVVTVTVLREGELMHFDVILGEHPAWFRPPPPQWTEEHVDLSAYAGEEILLRFEYVTMPGSPGYGIAIDDILIEATGYTDDAEDAAGGWEAAGWVRLDNALPGRFLIQLVQLEPAEVTTLLAPDETPEGEWAIEGSPARPALLVIAGATPHATLPAAYGYMVRTEEPAN